MGRNWAFNVMRPKKVVETMRGVAERETVCVCGTCDIAEINLQMLQIEKINQYNFMCFAVFFIKQFFILYRNIYREYLQ